MGGVNKAILLGNVGKNPDIKNLENNVMVATFPLATSESYRDKNSGDKKERTEWHNIVLWRGLAENAEKCELKKGDRIYVEGKIKTRKWKDKQEKEHFMVEIVADTFTVINRKKVTAGEEESSEEHE